MAIRLITFDIGGTLMNPHPSVGEVYREVLARHVIDSSPALLEGRFKEAFRKGNGIRGGRINDESERAFWRMIVGQTIREHCPKEKIEEVFDELYATFASPGRWRLKRDALPTLRALRDRGYILAILSNADSRMHRVISELGIGKYLHGVYLSTDIGFGKPDIRAFRHVEKAIGVSPEEIAHIGDSHYHDGEGAGKAGWCAYIVETGRTWERESYETIPSLDHLLGLFPGRKRALKSDQPRV